MLTDFKHRRRSFKRFIGLSVCVVSGEFRLTSAGGDQPQHGAPVSAHVRRGPATDLHPHAPRLVPAIPQLRRLQTTSTVVTQLHRRIV